MPKPRFIVFEGPDGSGKSTQARMLAEHMREAGEDVLLTREPGGSAVGEEIRSILLNPENREISRRCELLLYMASRAQIVKEVIQPALSSGRAVILDRYVYSSIAYQGYGQDLGPETVEEIGNFATNELRPDIVFLIDVDPETGFSRIDRDFDRMENLGMEFQARVREGYLETARANPDIFRVIDGTGTPDDVFSKVKEIVVGL